jgi:hypothetical protein
MHTSQLIQQSRVISYNPRVILYIPGRSSTTPEWTFTHQGDPLQPQGDPLHTRGILYDTRVILYTPVRSSTTPEWFFTHQGDPLQPKGDPLHTKAILYDSRVSICTSRMMLPYSKHDSWVSLCDSRVNYGAVGLWTIGPIYFWTVKLSGYRISNCRISD